MLNTFHSHVFMSWLSFLQTVTGTSMTMYLKFLPWFTDRARWLKESNPEAEELFRMAAEIFIFWAKSHVSKCLFYCPCFINLNFWTKYGLSFIILHHFQMKQHHSVCDHLTFVFRTSREKSRTLSSRMRSTICLFSSLTPSVRCQRWDILSGVKTLKGP